MANGRTIKATILKPKAYLTTRIMQNEEGINMSIAVRDGYYKSELEAKGAIMEDFENENRESQYDIYLCPEIVTHASIEYQVNYIDRHRTLYAYSYFITKVY